MYPEQSAGNTQQVIPRNTEASEEIARERTAHLSRLARQKEDARSEREFLIERRWSEDMAIAQYEKILRRANEMRARKKRQIENDEKRETEWHQELVRRSEETKRDQEEAERSIKEVEEEIDRQ